VLNISIRTNIKQISKNLTDLAYRQLPFAQAQAVTALAKRVRDVEVAGIKQTFPTATPFTLKSVGVKPARKDDPTAIIFVKDIAAQYLQPFETGGAHFLGGKKGLLVPIDQAVNKYGNLPRDALKSLKGRPDVFIGPVKTKAGIVNGVWQRVATSRNSSMVNQHGKLKKLRKLNTTGRLKLLIRFKDPQPVKQHMGWGSKAQAAVNKWWRIEFGKAMAKAITTAT
jgi:hypothetical protein